VGTSWRKAFGEEKLPFCLFQICGWDREDRLYWQTKLPIIQEVQHKAQLALPNIGFVVTADHPHGDTHPMVNRPIAERAVRWARAEVYGEKGVTWGTPVYQSKKKDRKRLILSFRTPGNEALKITGEPAGFVIAGEEKKFAEARAEVVDRTSVAVWSDQVADPVTARYAWSQRAICHLYTESDLPVGPFRTDDWPIPASEIRD
jgi:sialate O-acetylesterase